MAKKGTDKTPPRPRQEEEDVGDDGDGDVDADLAGDDELLAQLGIKDDDAPPSADEEAELAILMGLPPPKPKSKSSTPPSKPKPRASAPPAKSRQPTAYETMDDDDEPSAPSDDDLPPSYDQMSQHNKPVAKQSPAPTKAPAPITHEQEDEDDVNEDDHNTDDDGDDDVNVSAEPEVDVAQQKALVETRIKQYKYAALQYKHAGDMETARKCLTHAKIMQDQWMPQLDIGVSIDQPIPAEPPLPKPQAQPKPPASAPAPQPRAAVAVAPKPAPVKQAPVATQARMPASSKTAAAAQKPVPAPSLPVETETRNVTMSMLEALVHTGIEEASAEAKECLDRGDKHNAAVFHKEKKRLDDLMKQIPSMSPALTPTVAFLRLSYFYDRINSDLLDNQLCVVLEKGMNVKFPSHSLQLTLSLGDKPQVETTKSFSTKVADIDYENTRVNFTIDPSKKSTRTFFERKKLDLEVVTTKFLGMGHESKGFGELRLSELLTKSETTETIPLVDAKKKPLGTQMRVTLRVRQPLGGVDRVNVHKDLVKLVSWNSAGTASSSATPTPQTVVTTTPVTVTPVPSSSSQVSATPTPQATSSATAPAVIPVAAKPVQPAAQPAVQPAVQPVAQPAVQPAVQPAAGGVSAAALQDPNAVELLVSNDVLEAELKKLPVQMAALERKQKAGTLTDQEDEQLLALEDRKQAVELKLQVLVLSVSVGKLTLPAYIDQLRAAVANDKRLALALKKDNRIDDAKTVLMRIKIMENEIESASNMGDDDDADQ